MNCLNCNVPNPSGVKRCVACRIPGDFGKAPVTVATVITPQHVACNNCAGHAPVTAKNCPTCRWPLPENIKGDTSTSFHEESSASAPANSAGLSASQRNKSSHPPGIQYRRAG